MFRVQSPLCHTPRRGFRVAALLLSCVAALTLGGCHDGLHAVSFGSYGYHHGGHHGGHHGYHRGHRKHHGYKHRGHKHRGHHHHGLSYSFGYSSGYHGYGYGYGRSLGKYRGGGHYHRPYRSGRRGYGRRGGGRKCY